MGHILYLLCSFLLTPDWNSGPQGRHTDGLLHRHLGSWVTFQSAGPTGQRSPLETDIKPVRDPAKATRQVGLKLNPHVTGLKTFPKIAFEAPSLQRAKGPGQWEVSLGWT